MAKRDGARYSDIYKYTVFRDYYTLIVGPETKSRRLRIMMFSKHNSQCKCDCVVK